MSDLIRRAEQALEGITPGPWIHEMTVEGGENCHYVRDDGREHLAVFTGNYGGAVADAEFIAAAPDLVRDLLAEVKRLRSAGYDAFGWQRRCERAEADRDSAVAAVKRAGALADKWADGSSNAMPEECAAELRRALAGEVDE